ncbi:MAG TPA: DUF4350 domain-containing protein, partial [Steroidobacteraceae bacterium]
MRERLITLLCAMGALLLFAAMFVRRDAGFDARGEIPRPTTVERRGNGYHAAMAWLDAEGIRTVSLRQRFETLPEREDLPPKGNLLIVTLPAVTQFRTEEFLPLDRWIRAGNTLLVLAALSDNPDWAFAQGGLASGDLNVLTGLEFETVRARQARLKSRGAASEKKDERRGDEEFRNIARAFGEPQRSTLVPNRPHAFFSGVNEVVALSDYSTQPWSVRVPYEGFVLALARQRETGEGVFWTRPLGSGRIIVSGMGSVFTNRALGLADNAKLLANIVAATVGEKGVVLFDDVHQGLGATYDPSKFYTDRRLYLTIAILLGVWFVWVLGSTRLRAPVSRIPTPREAELVRAAGAFLSRALPKGAGAQRLVENFFQRLNERTGRPPGSTPWELLER